MSDKLVSVGKIIELHTKLRDHILDLIKTLRGLRGNSSSYDDSKWKIDIERDPRPTVRLLYRELTKAEANLKALETMEFPFYQPSDVELIDGIKKSMEV